MAGEPTHIDDHGIHWWQDETGRPHRDDGPAVWHPDGLALWYQHGRYHRSNDDGPTCTWVGGAQAWYRHGVLHRDGGPAKIDPDGWETWYRNGEVHREDGPAIVPPPPHAPEYMLHGWLISKENHAEFVAMDDADQRAVVYLAEKSHHRYVDLMNWAMDTYRMHRKLDRRPS